MSFKWSKNGQKKPGKNGMKRPFLLTIRKMVEIMALNKRRNQTKMALLKQKAR
jgi:hypothetical protein